MHLYGTVGGCWAVEAFREITIPPPFSIEFMVYNGTEDLYGCHPYRGSLILRSGTNWWDCGRLLMMFHEDGRIQLDDSVGWHYNELEWVKVRVDYSRPTETSVHLVFWVNDSLLYEADDDIISCEDNLAYVDLGAQEGTVWFDDVRVLVNTRPNSYSLISPLNDDSVKTPVTLTWQPSIDPDPNDTVRYDLHLSRSAVFAPESTVVYDSLLDTTFTDSLDCKTWYWKVRAYDKWGAVRWSDQSWSFYVFLGGDINADCIISLADVVCLARYILIGDYIPVPLKSGDVSCNGKIELADAICLANYILKGHCDFFPCDP